ncbi:MAG: hypothetical protein Aureis2KO_25410 [Aureisphaera sp.]
MSEVKKNETAAAETPFVRYDEYWLQKARTLIDDSVALFTRRLTTLNKFLNYLAAGTFLGGITFTTYTQSPHLEVYLLAVIPFIFIAIAKYRVGVKGSEPAITDTNMRSPSEINQDYGELLKTLSAQTKDATIWVAIATAFTLVCLPFAVFFQNRLSQVTPPAQYVSVQNVNKVVQVHGLLPKAENISVTLYGKSTLKKDSIVPGHTTAVIPKEDGSFMANYVLENFKMTMDSVHVAYQLSNKLHHYTYRGAVTPKVSTTQAKPAKDKKATEKKTDTAKAKKPKS